MRLLPLLPALVAASAAFSPAYADTLPVGIYSLSAQTTMTGIHASPDQGTLSGTLNFSASSVLTAANLVFRDITNGQNYSLTVPGLTTYTPAAHLLSATIYNATSPSTVMYYFSISTNTPDSTYRLTCGTDCDTDFVLLDGSGRLLLNEELLGAIAPAPEPSALLLVGTGLLAGAGLLWRRPAAV